MSRNAFFRIDFVDGISFCKQTAAKSAVFKLARDGMGCFAHFALPISYLIDIELACDVSVFKTGFDTRKTRHMTKDNTSTLGSALHRSMDWWLLTLGIRR